MSHGNVAYVVMAGFSPDIGQTGETDPAWVGFSFVVLASDNSVVFTAASQANFSYGDSGQTIRESVIAQIEVVLSENNITDAVSGYEFITG